MREGAECAQPLKDPCSHRSQHRQGKQCKGTPTSIDTETGQHCFFNVQADGCEILTNIHHRGSQKWPASSNGALIHL